MSYPKMDNSVKTAITDLKEIVGRTRTDTKEVFDLVSESENSIIEIEVKAQTIVHSTKKDAENGLAITGPILPGAVTAY